MSSARTPQNRIALLVCIDRASLHTMSALEAADIPDDFGVHRGGRVFFGEVKLDGESCLLLLPS